MRAYLVLNGGEIWDRGRTTATLYKNKKEAAGWIEWFWKCSCKTIDKKAFSIKEAIIKED
ncbi:MAG: hypothetical protein WC455_17850 [Dehalococcoidia bacterium]|jgi:hypothetical protein